MGSLSNEEFGVVQAWRGGVESPAEFSVLVASEIMVPMRDGVRLATDVYLPAEVGRPDQRAAGTFPVVLVRTPYDKRTALSRATGEYFASRGYAVAIQDVRGRYRSEGTFYFLTQEAEDGYDAVEWCGTQPWSSGKVGMMGTSYPGWCQTAAAVLDPPHLATVVVNQAGANAYTSSVRHNGAMELRFVAWAFLDAATNSEALADPRLAEAAGAVRASEWIDRLPLRPGHSPLAMNPSVERWALDLYTTGDHGPYWEQPGFDFQRHWGDHADIPMLLLGAWYDSYTRATIENFNGLRSRKRGPVHLVMGPWTHGAAAVDQSFAGDVEFGPTAPVAGNLARDFNHLHLRWFDRWLKEMDNGVDREDPVRWFMMGSGDGTRTRDGRLWRGGEWRCAQDMPPAGTKQTGYHLLPGGGLGVEPPTAETSSTSWRFDPHDPVPTVGGNISSLSEFHPVPEVVSAKIPIEQRWGLYVSVGGQDQRTGPGVHGAGEPYGPLSSRTDVAVFQTEPLTEEVEVVGPLRAVLHVSSDAPDTDVTVKVVDVFPPSDDYPEGYHLNISDSIFRMRYRESWQDPTPMADGEVYEVEVPMYGTGAVFGAGHRIRVDISSSNYPRFDVNPNTGEPIGRHRRTRVATNSVHHDVSRPSRVELPVVARRDVAARPDGDDGRP